MQFNLEEAKTKTIEFLNKKSYSLVRPEFNKYDPIYSFTSENISYLEKMNVKDKDALTVTGSFDHCLNLIFEGAKSVHNIDVNILTIFYAKFKLAAMKTFSYHEFLDFFLGENQFNYSSYLKFRNRLEPVFQDYWDFIYKLFSYDNNKLSQSRLFDKPSSVKEAINLNPYLKSEENYEKTKERLNNVSITFDNKSILDIGDGEETYDIMLFSNVETYLVEDELSRLINEEEYLDFIHNKASKQLNENGVIQLAYNYYHQSINETPTKIGFIKIKKSKKTTNEIEYLKSYKKIIIEHAPLTKMVASKYNDCVYLFVKNSKKNNKTL